MIQKVEVAGQAFSVYSAGQENDDVVLMVHGFPLDHRIWKFQFEPLSQTHHVIAPDLAGFGASPTERVEFSLEQMADDLAAIVGQLVPGKRVNFCGLSMGGYVGWQFWKRHPDLLKRLIAVDTRSAADTPEVARARRIMAKGVLNDGSENVASAMLGKLFAPESLSDPGMRKNVEDVRNVIATCAPQSVAAGHLAMSVREDATKWLSEISVPSLVIVGEHDVITTPAEMKQMADQMADAKFRLIKNAGHLAALENPAAFNHCLIEFLIDSTV